MSFFSKLRNFPSAFYQAVRNQDGIIETADKIIIAKATKSGHGESQPTKVTAKARHAGMIYNYSWNSRFGEENYSLQEYDMSVVANAVDTDSYFRRAVEKYVELIWKSGYSFVGKNTKAVKYVRKRFEQMAQVTSNPTEELLRTMSYQLVTYANVYISKVRDEDASGGRYRKTFTGQLLAPVAGYFVEDTVSIQLAFKENGEPIGYKQHIPGTRKAKIWRPWNIVHMFYSKKPGLRVGTPLVWPVLDDIRALRKMEQNIELLIFQHTIPLFHYKIGTPERPAQEAEISATKATVEKMPPNGCIVTPERHSIEAIGVERKALDASKYIEYFKQRVLAGLGMSSVGMGEGSTANKSTASVLDKHMHNTTETFQRVIKMFIDEHMIKELLLEGGYSFDAFDEDNKVEIQFPPIDNEVQFAKENHYAQMYTQHALTEAEMRKEFGRDAIEDGEREDMYLERVAKILGIINAPDESFMQAQVTKTTTTNTPNGSVKKTVKLPPQATPEGKAANKGANRDRPTNQSGRALSKPRIAKNDELLESILSVFECTKLDTIDTYKDYANTEDFSPGIISTMKSRAFDMSKTMIGEKIGESDTVDNKDFLEKKTSQVFDDVFSRVSRVFEMKDSYDAVSRINSIFESSRCALDSVYDTCRKQEEPEE